MVKCHECSYLGHEIINIYPKIGGYTDGFLYVCYLNPTKLELNTEDLRKNVCNICDE